MGVRGSADQNIVAVIRDRYRGEDGLGRGLRFFGQHDVDKGRMIEWSLDDLAVLVKAHG